MLKRLTAILLAAIILFSCSVTVSACDENQTNQYVTQVLFGLEAKKYESDKNVQLLLKALYLCSEQSDKLGKTQLNTLEQSIKRVPSLDELDIKGTYLAECSHRSWDYESANIKQKQDERKNLLRHTVNTVFDFGLLNKWFNSSNGKCDSFAALLYYTHILSDYLANDPENTEVKSLSIGAYSGVPYVELNGNEPTFTAQQKKSTEPFEEYSQLDAYNRSGVAFVNVCSDTMPPSNSRQQIGNIKPSGWHQERYDGLVNSSPPYLYNRCHLIAHELDGNDGKQNLITGTRYLNATGMKRFEDMVAQYVKKTGNHVLYRATPIYIRENAVASGVQIEAYSVEDQGEGIKFNVYCYNVQPGVEIVYASGVNKKVDLTGSQEKSQDYIPFVAHSPSDSNPDLDFELRKHLKDLFDDQENDAKPLLDELESIANKARNVGDQGESPATRYIKLKEYEYQYFEVLERYVPELLKKEKFFNSTFQ